MLRPAYGHRNCSILLICYIRSILFSNIIVDSQKYSCLLKTAIAMQCIYVIRTNTSIFYYLMISILIHTLILIAYHSDAINLWQKFCSAHGITEVSSYALLCFFFKILLILHLVLKKTFFIFLFSLA